MSMHVEWATAAEEPAQVYGPGAHLGEAQVDDHAVVVGGLGGGCVALEGSLEQLEFWAANLLGKIRNIQAGRESVEEA